ncbi:MAG: tetratricopeptide repeat protein [Haliscomenobacter sp.]
MRALFLWLFFSFAAFGTAWGQGSLAEKKRHAKELFLSAHYQEAYHLLQSTGDGRQPDAETNFLMALCLYQLNDLDAAETILLNLINTRSAYSESWLYMARIFHDRHEFLKATEYYKAYLKVLSPNAPNRSAVREAIRRCSNGIQWQYRKPLAIVENLGPEVNTAFDEFGPIPSPTTNERLYFSSARPGCSGGPRNSNGQPDELYGRYTCDIFFTQLQNGQWKSPSGISYLVNTPKHEIAFGFGKDGSVMYYFKGNNFSQGQIFIDSFRVGTTNILSSDILYSPVEPIAGISAPFFVQDSVIIFPSQRPGGYGGLDLYRTVYSQGNWSTPQNLGPEINSAYDETTPFLARDGQSLYFSTNNPEYSIGGFDILKTVFNPYIGHWSSPVNLGVPINSAGDETHFSLSRDGYTAFFASSRKDGYGERDLYAAYFMDYLPEMGQNNRSGLRLPSSAMNTHYVAAPPIPTEPTYPFIHFFPNYHKIERP